MHWTRPARNLPSGENATEHDAPVGDRQGRDLRSPVVVSQSFTSPGSAL